MIDLESREFYELMQCYRNCPRDQPQNVVIAFEAVKRYILLSLFDFKEFVEVRNATIIQMRQDGYRRRAIADCMGLSDSRVKQILSEYKRRNNG